MDAPVSSKSILVVDDDRDVRETVADALRAVGYRVREAQNGKEALAQLHGGGPEPCLVLLDMMMPEMNGAELLALLHEAHRLASLPVVAVSGETGEAQGARGVLRKPVSIGVLLRVVEQYCGAP